MDDPGAEEDGEKPEGRRGKLLLTDLTTGERYGRLSDGTKFKFAPEGQEPTPEEWFSEE